VDVIGAALKLVADFPFTGGGLGAFGGLYSRYIRVIPDYVLNYSHNFYLDVALEQGWPGFLALIVILVGTAWLIITRRAAHNLLRWAMFMSLAVVCVHGLVDDALYGVQGTPLLFALAGLAVAMGGTDTAPAAARKWTWILVGASLVAGAALAGIHHRRLLARWHANLGAVEMARVELAGWPWPDREDRVDVAQLTPAKMLFHQSLQLDSDNRTARYRLGLIAARRNDYAAIAAQLEPAYRAQPDHPGVRKVLGYTYVWLGELDRAKEVLAAVPEAQADMTVYAWWWGTQGRDDLAERAAVMAARLEASPGP
jgi:tetratricopeptide (TPR) repeat protein